ncbi:gamma-glutamyltranspeptidase/glutathione hydrolase [Catalinimonas alkaloidigena]|uniref:gamma-glutamyltransferase family protein n=1 Tax=Catalinimonas alkaloidigena TaxID=1075417 RepID=UPI0024050CDE|nr:gamma-glutamyltransferase [Catalinimonas alkaloidigena]MDF9798601.1 gamma-glutamyltranspeptidase/glutathione hydrolase [Catalinimonas alkaloidigena]
MKNLLFLLALACISISCQDSQQSAKTETIEEPALTQSAQAGGGMVAAAHPLATAAGQQMLSLGGNAVDAAVAAAFTLAVVEPSMSGLGGRLQAILRLPDGKVRGVDATTQAPMSYDAANAPQGSYGYPTIGIPGVVAGLTKLLEEHGSLPLTKVMEPAIRYAEEGFALLPGEATRHALALKEIQEFEGTSTYFLKEDTTTYAEGEILVQKDLAKTLRAIAEGGDEAFYRGAIAEKIIADIQANGGVLSMEDLSNYEALDADILNSTYRGNEVYALSMPSYGAITLEILNILENMPMQEASEVEWASNMYLAVERAYEDRRSQTADSIPILISKDYAQKVASQLSSPNVLTHLPPKDIEVPQSWLAEQGHTTHLSTADGNGMMVALTQSLGPNMGSKVASPGLGFLYAVTLGGYLGDFEPGQRAASHISPIVITKNDQPYLALGAAGGSRIISAITSVSSRVIDQNMELAEALAAPRVHPDDADSVFVETHSGEGWQDEVLEALKAKGFLLNEVPEVARFGRVHAVEYNADTQQFVGAADPDWEGAAAGVQ